MFGVYLSTQNRKIWIKLWIAINQCITKTECIEMSWQYYYNSEMSYRCIVSNNLFTCDMASGYGHYWYSQNIIKKEFLLVFLPFAVTILMIWIDLVWLETSNVQIKYVKYDKYMTCGWKIIWHIFFLSFLQGHHV